MELLMMLSAQWHGEFVADLASERSWLGEFEVVGVARRALADQTGLGGDKGKMSFVPLANGLEYGFDQLQFGRLGCLANFRFFPNGSQLRWWWAGQIEAVQHPLVGYLHRARVLSCQCVLCSQVPVRPDCKAFVILELMD